MSNDHEALTNTLRPCIVLLVHLIIVSDATITIRVIKSFPYRIVKNLVLQHVDLGTITVIDLTKQVKDAIQTQPGWKVYKGCELDTFKLYTHAHGSKTTNLIINLDHDDWVFKDTKATLASLNVEHESEVSFFNYSAYLAFLADPTEKWS